MTGPANAALGEDHVGTLVLLGWHHGNLALVDDDPDNHVLARLEEGPAVSCRRGLFRRPGDIANPATHAEVVDE